MRFLISELGIILYLMVFLTVILCNRNFGYPSGNHWKTSTHKQKCTGLLAAGNVGDPS